MTGTHEYILSERELDPESARLARLEQIFDPATIRYLEALNIAPGSRCLEVGAGRGSIARWLAAQVGPGGEVVAADIDCRFLTDLPANVQVRQLDIRTEDAAPAGFDLVHCRALLAHLPDPAVALARMSAALRPGGVLMAEEPDYGPLTFSGHPEADWATEVHRRVFDALKAARVVNAYLGPGLAGLLGDAGLHVLGGEFSGGVQRSAEPWFETWRLTLEAMSPNLIAAGILTADEAARWHRAINNPATVCTTWVLVSAWGRRVA